MMLNSTLMPSPYTVFLNFNSRKCVRWPQTSDVSALKKNSEKTAERGSGPSCGDALKNVRWCVGTLYTVATAYYTCVHNMYMYKISY